MEKIIYAFRSTQIDFRSILLASSIRSFAGKFKDCPIIIAYSKNPNKIPNNLRESIERLNITLIPFNLPDDFQREFFADFVKGAALIEEKYGSKTKNLVWLGPDTLVLKEPIDFLLPEPIAIGYRPVHHINIGLPISSPIDEYWRLIYELCDVPSNRIFSMETHADLNIIRPYFNAGSIVVRPSSNLFQNWWKKYQDCHLNQRYLNLCKKNPANHIFFHQAILSGLILNKHSKSEMIELPKSYNYPLHLHGQNLRNDKPETFDHLTTVRYENHEVLANAKFSQNIKKWLAKSGFF